VADRCADLAARQVVPARLSTMAVRPGANCAASTASRAKAPTLPPGVKPGAARDDGLRSAAWDSHGDARLLGRRGSLEP